MGRSIKILCLFLAGLFISSCKKDSSDETTTKHFPPPSGTRGVFITNEGGFNHGNGTVSYYNISENHVDVDLCKTVGEKPLGDIVQSITINGGKAYIVVNNSRKIEVVNVSNFKRVATIKGDTISPRYVLIVNQKAYVSNLYYNAISVIDLATNAIIKRIPCKGWTEEMLELDGIVYITNVRKDQLYLLDSKTDNIIDSVKVTYGGNSIQKDKNNKIWLLCGDPYGTNALPALYRIDPSTRKSEMEYIFAAGQGPEKLRISPGGDTLYYLNSSVYRMDINSSTLPSSPFIKNTGYFYGLGVDPISGDIYVSDAIDFNQQGMVSRYTRNAKLITSFRTGVGPGNFSFTNY